MFRLSDLRICINTYAYGEAPQTLFNGGEVGLFLDTQDLSTMFQDVARTIPAAVNQPVAVRLDKSGRGNHMAQAAVANRPILRLSGGRYYLEYDGANDFFSGSVNLSSVNKLTAFTAMRVINRASAPVLVEHGSGTLGNGFSILHEAAAIQPLTAGSVATYVDTQVSAPVIKTAGFDRAGATAAAEIPMMRRNGAALTGVTYTLNVGASGNFASDTLYIGARAGTALFANMHDYGVIVVGKAVDAATALSVESWLNSRCGAY